MQKSMRGCKARDPRRISICEGYSLLCNLAVRPTRRMYALTSSSSRLRYRRGISMCQRVHICEGYLLLCNRAVRPTRWMYAFMSSGQSTWMTQSTPMKSSPRAATSVANRAMPSFACIPHHYKHYSSTTFKQSTQMLLPASGSKDRCNTNMDNGTG
jgi:hypothetical protein